MTDYFAVFGLERRLDLDMAALERRYYALSRRLHPDRNPNSIEPMAVLNDAYRTLRDPAGRAEHLLALEGVAGSKSVAPELLEEMFEWNERLEGGASEEDCRRLASLREEVDRRLPPERDLDRIRTLLDRRRYLTNLIGKHCHE